MFTPFFSKLALQNTLIIWLHNSKSCSGILHNYYLLVFRRTPRMKYEFYVFGIAQAREFIN